MPRKKKYVICYAPEIRSHVEAIPQKHHGLIQREILEQLSFSPDEPTRNRKPLDDLPGPLGSTWELRFGPQNRFRIFYEIIEETFEVRILAIGVKDRNRLFFAGKENTL